METLHYERRDDCLNTKTPLCFQVNALFTSSGTCLRPCNPYMFKFSCLPWHVSQENWEYLDVFKQSKVFLIARWNICRQLAVEINLHDIYSLRPLYGKKNNQKLCGSFNCLSIDLFYVETYYLRQGGIKFVTIYLSVCRSFRRSFHLFVSRINLILLIPLFWKNSTVRVSL